jgi:hypothetical protein
MEVFFFVILFGGIGLGIRLLAGKFDRERIREELSSAGCEVLDITWSPFGTGWFGEKSDRIYAVRYRTSDGEILDATCKTSMTTGVYWSSGSPPTKFGEGRRSVRRVSARRSAQGGCLRCGTAVSEEARFCSNCGGKL